MGDEERNYDEIVALRKRAHETEAACARTGWRMDSYDDWRTGVELRLSGLDERVSGMVKADEIAEAVATKMKGQRTLKLTIAQKGVFLFFGAITCMNGLHALGVF